MLQDEDESRQIMELQKMRKLFEVMHREVRNIYVEKFGEAYIGSQASMSRSGHIEKSGMHYIDKSEHIEKSTCSKVKKVVS